MPCRVVYITALKNNEFEIRKSNILPTKAEMEKFFKETSSSSVTCRLRDFRTAYPKIYDFLGGPFISYYPCTARGKPSNAVIHKATNRIICGNGILIREFK